MRGEREGAGRGEGTHEARRVGGTDTRATVADGLVGDGEFAEVEANHLGLDLNSVCARGEGGG